MTTDGRKRKRHGRVEIESRKKARIEAGDVAEVQTIEHPTLRRYYRQISTLRSYLIARLPDQAKSRRRKIKAAGRVKDGSADIGIAPGEAGGTAPASSRHPNRLGRGSGDGQTRLAALLDNTLVCNPETSISPLKDSREKDFMKFSQQAEISFGSTLDGGTTSISDVSNSENPPAYIFAIAPCGVLPRGEWEEHPSIEGLTISCGMKFPSDHQMCKNWTLRSS